MAVTQSQITIPSDGTPISILSSNTANANQINIRNTGTNTVLIGPQNFLPPPLSLLAAPVGSGGTFVAGTYFWQITALNAYGQTQGSQEQFGTIALNGSCTLSWAAVSGATNYKVYRSTVTGGEATSPALVVTQAGTTYTDTGTAVSSGAVPATNTAQIPLLFPLATNEYLGWEGKVPDYMAAQVKTAGTAGQITVLAVG